MQRPGIRANPPNGHSRPFKQLKELVSFILRIICIIFFILLIHYCVTKESMKRKVHVEQDVAEINPRIATENSTEPQEKVHVEQDVAEINSRIVTKNNSESQEKQDTKNDTLFCPDQSQDDLTTQLRECRENAKLNDLMDIRRFRNRANIYECQVACLYPVAQSNLYESLKEYIGPTPKLKPEDPAILIQDVPKDQTSNWKFDPQLTILHFEFNKLVLPEAVIFEYSAVEELKVKLIGIIHNSEDSLLQAKQKIGAFVKQVEIDDYLLEERDEFSRYYENYEQTIMARLINYPDDIQYFNAIRIEISSSSSSSGLSDDHTKDFSFSRIKIMEVQ